MQMPRRPSVTNETAKRVIEKFNWGADLGVILYQERTVSAAALERILLNKTHKKVLADLLDGQFRPAIAQMYREKLRAKREDNTGKVQP